MKKLTVLLIAVALLFASCKKDVIANFTYEPKEPKIGETIYFTNKSVGAVRYKWTLDGSWNVFSTDENPTLKITDKLGERKICLYAYPGKKDEWADVINIWIKIYPK